MSAGRWVSSPARPKSGRRWASAGEQHEREEALGFGFVGHEVDEQPAESDRFGAEVVAHECVAAARGVALVEHEVDRGQDGAQSVREIDIAWHSVRDSGVSDLGFAADDPLGHRRLGHEERAGDLGRRQAAEQAEGERDARRGRERRVAAGEDQAEAVVVHGTLLVGGWFVRGVEQGGLGVAVVARGFAAEAIDGAVAGRGDQPSRGAWW
jgi:hypothetical protein